MATITQEVEVEVEMEAEHITVYIGELDSEDALELAREVLGAMSSRHCRELATEIIKEEGDEKTGRNCLAESLVQELHDDKLVALIKEMLDLVDIDTSTAIMEHAMNRVQELKKEEQDDEDLKESLNKEDKPACNDCLKSLSNGKKFCDAHGGFSAVADGEVDDRQAYRAATNLSNLYDGGDL
jgi:hypothetical protein